VTKGGAVTLGVNGRSSVGPFMEAEEGAGHGAEPASRGSLRPCNKLQIIATAVRPGGGTPPPPPATMRKGAGEGPVLPGVGGLPDLRCCGVPPVQADRRALWLSF
jgi:hypothetical protein